MSHSPNRFLCLLSLLSACGGSSSSSPPDAAGQPDADVREQVMAGWANACGDPLDSVYQVPAAPAPWDEQARGTIARCAYERRISIDEMTADLTDQGATVVPTLSTAIHKVRVSYWTEREPGTPVLTSGVMYIPEQLRADPSPLVVLGHGSVGIADKCAPSREDPEGFAKDWRRLVYTFAGDGWLVVMPDFPGLGTPGVAPWMYSIDEGHSLLDATRAVRRLGPDKVGDHNVIVGHSLGGHAALSAQAQFADYGAAGSLDAVVVLNPFWLNNGAWGALLTSVGNLLIDSTFMSLTMQYFYGHLAVYEGEQHAGDAFLADKRDAIVDMLESECWQDVTSDQRGPTKLGIRTGPQGYTPGWVADVGNCGLSDDCATPLGQAWRPRFVVDRPAVDPTIPIVHYTGAADDFIMPSFQQCGIDRLVAEGAAVTVCVDPDADHSQIVTSTADWTRQYLASVMLGEPPPAACAGQEVYDQQPVCQLPIPNPTDAGTP